ncbi:MAG TPA: hypothetical protein VMM82_06850, partial [Spirochaetia bacterium]|nr:hypothetical protein [Spirochaetia bacterium]
LTNVGDLQALKDALHADPDYSYTIPAYIVNKSIYLPLVPNFIAWNSFAAKGTGGFDPWNNAMTSTGSLWWKLASYIPIY